MQFPVLVKDLRLSLRRLEAFVSAFTFYSALTVVITLLWGQIAPSYSYTALEHRDEAARSLFWGFLLLGYLGFCFHGGIAASRVLAQERDKDTLDLLRTAPIKGGSLVFQKLVTPFLLEILLFFGVLPVLALLFMMGGISPGEYAYQLTNLFVWIVTSIMIGLWVSSSARTTTRAVRRTFYILVVALFFLPTLASLFNVAVYFFFGVVYSFRWSNTLAEAIGWFTVAVSPVGMLSSWDQTYGHSSGFFRFIDGIVPGHWVSLSPTPAWPLKRDGTFPWLTHLGIQFILFRRTANNCRKLLVDSERTEKSQDRSLRSSWSSFSGGWMAFCEFEGRWVFRSGRKGRNLAIGLYFAAVATVAFFFGREPLVLLPLLVVLFFSFALAPNSFRRERETETSVFLLTSPILPREYLLGKWIYYQSVSVAAWLVAFVTAATLAAANGRSTPPFFFLIGALIPMLSLEGLMVGLRVRRKASPLRFLIPIGVFVAGALFLLVLGQLQFRRFRGGRYITGGLSDLVYFHPALFALVIPMGLITLCALFLLRGVDAPQTEKEKKVRERFAHWILAYLGVDLLSAILIPADYNAPGIREYLRCLFAGIVFNWLPWVWLVRRPEKWWRFRLLGIEDL